MSEETRYGKNRTPPRGRLTLFWASLDERKCTTAVGEKEWSRRVWSCVRREPNDQHQQSAESRKIVAARVTVLSDLWLTRDSCLLVCAKGATHLRRTAAPE